MQIDNNIWRSPVRRITAKVELANSSAVASYTDKDKLKSFTIERVGEESKFFGFGVCQKANIHLIDTQRALEFTTEHKCKCYLNNLDTFPQFKITEVHRDENTGELSITAYDALYGAAAHTFAELNLAAPYSVADVAMAIADFLELGIDTNVEDMSFDTTFNEGANFEGTENLREVLNDIAEATQTIYYIDKIETLYFKRPDVNGEAALTIGKADYITLDSKTNRRLSDICSATELGDNVITTSGTIGTIQYVRDNPFWELNESIVELLDNALAAVGGMTVNQFECTWRGNPELEIADKIALTTKDDKTVASYVFDDVIEYNGGLTQKTRWSYTDNENESTDNPSTLGDALRKTFAKVDKANAEIEMVAGETAAIKLTSDSIQTSVTQIDEEMADIMAEVNTKVTANDVSFSIQTAMGEGIERITTSTGFTFNEEGLHIDKENGEISTSITEDGMKVNRKNKEVLVADNFGVKAEDLHATTFLIIGKNSRLENYGSKRTGCFWIGN